tara:strand:+ start:8049 stop:8405 length:357 start_codon:yes stop_codon:yes gene_type:complete
MPSNQNCRDVHGGNKQQRPKRKPAHVFCRMLLSFATSGIKDERTILNGYDMFLNGLEDRAQTRRSARSSLLNMAVVISDYALLFVNITISVAFILLLRIVLLDLRLVLLDKGRISFLF